MDEELMLKTPTCYLFCVSLVTYLIIMTIIIKITMLMTCAFPLSGTFLRAFLGNNSRIQSFEIMSHYP